MMNHRIKSIVASGAAALALVASTSAQIFAYDNLNTTPTAGYGQANTNNPIFGDQLNLTQSGQLSILGCSLYNSTSGGNTGLIDTGTMVVKFYDNTTPYAGGAIAGTLLGSATLSWDFTGGGGLPAGYYSTSTFDLTSLDINLTQHVLVTQQFTEATGTSTQNGVVLFSNPVVGSSPANVFIESSTTPEGLYTFSSNPNQFGYQIQLVPEPATYALGCLGVTTLIIFRRRK